MLRVRNCQLPERLERRKELAIADGKLDRQDFGIGDLFCSARASVGLAAPLESHSGAAFVGYSFLGVPPWDSESLVQFLANRMPEEFERNSAKKFSAARELARSALRRASSRPRRFQVRSHLTV